MSFGQRLGAEFARRIAGDVDVSSETAFDLWERGREFSPADAPDDHEVHVAERVFVTARDRPVRRCRYPWLRALNKLYRQLCWGGSVNVKTLAFPTEVPDVRRSVG